MTSGIRLKILLSFGVLAVVLGCSSTASSQTPCFTYTLPPGVKEAKATPGSHLDSVKLVDGQLVVTVCSDNTANPSPSTQPTVTPTETPEEARQRKAREREERLSGREQKETGADRRAARERGEFP